MESEQEEYENGEEEEELKSKKKITFGFSAILDSIVTDKRSHLGYTKLEPEEPKREKVRFQILSKYFQHYFFKVTFFPRSFWIRILR